jgi:hypothetical protein
LAVRSEFCRRCGFKAARDKGGHSGTKEPEQGAAAQRIGCEDGGKLEPSSILADFSIALDCHSAKSSFAGRLAEASA